MNEITLEHVREAKEELEAQIESAIKSFINKTGLNESEITQIKLLHGDSIIVEVGIVISYPSKKYEETLEEENKQ